MDTNEFNCSIAGIAKPSPDETPTAYGADSAEYPPEDRTEAATSGGDKIVPDRNTSDCSLGRFFGAPLRRHSAILRPSRRGLMKDFVLLGLCSWDILERRRTSRRMLPPESGNLSDEAGALGTVMDVSPDAASPNRVFTLPIPGLSTATVPASRLPNASRAYRHGRHRGIDL